MFSLSVVVALSIALPHNLRVAVAIPTASSSSFLQFWLGLGLPKQTLPVTSILCSH